MTCSPDVNYEELARSTDEFNGAQLKAVCVEAGMFALREGAKTLSHEHFLSGIAEGMFVPADPTDARSDPLLQCKAKRRMSSCISHNPSVPVAISYIMRVCSGGRSQTEASERDRRIGDIAEPCRHHSSRRKAKGYVSAIQKALACTAKSVWMPPPTCFSAPPTSPRPSPSRGATSTSPLVGSPPDLRAGHLDA
jgi:SpoVK/Ycf46/Vps4 family AAA+-type ATPase